MIVGSGGGDEVWWGVERAPLLPLCPSPKYSLQHSDQRYPAPGNTKGSALLSNRGAKTAPPKKWPK